MQNVDSILLWTEDLFPHSKKKKIEDINLNDFNIDSVLKRHCPFIVYVSSSNSNETKLLKNRFGNKGIVK